MFCEEQRVSGIQIKFQQDCAHPKHRTMHSLSPVYHGHSKANTENGKGRIRGTGFGKRKYQTPLVAVTLNHVVRASTSQCFTYAHSLTPAGDRHPLGPSPPLPPQPKKLRQPRGHHSLSPVAARDLASTSQMAGVIQHLGWSFATVFLDQYWQFSPGSCFIAGLLEINM